MDNHTANRTLMPSQALIIYEGKRTYNRDYYIETREIKSIGGKLQLMAPMPLSENTLKDIATTYIKKSEVNMSFGRIIPEHILHGSNKPGKTIVLWYRPSMKRKLNFSASLKIKDSVEVTVPATLYLVVNHELYIFALSSNQRPNAETKLFNAPYFNIYKDGNVCLGTAQVGNKKAETFEKEAERFEVAFYMAEQNMGHHTTMSKTNTSKIWTSLIKSKKPFPVKELVPHHKFKTLSHLLNQFINEKNS